MSALESRLLLHNCTILRNSAWAGGAISFAFRSYSKEVSLEVQDSRFDDNLGGTCRCVAVAIRVTGCSLVWFSSRCSIVVAGAHLFLYTFRRLQCLTEQELVARISNSTFENAFSLLGSVTTLYSSLNVENSRFIDCGSALSGGALNFIGGNHHLKLLDTSFEACTSRMGAAISIGVGPRDPDRSICRSERTIQRCHFTENSGVSGGAIRNFLTTSLEIADSHFTSNVAESSGGAVYGIGDGLLTVTGGTFTYAVLSRCSLFITVSVIRWWRSRSCCSLCAAIVLDSF